MLASVQKYYVLESYWWMFLPGIILVPIFLLYYALAAGLLARVKTPESRGLNKVASGNRLQVAI
jgi:ABC-type dipeptide/oligopeptide/nickel transport system permease subunit